MQASVGQLEGYFVILPCTDDVMTTLMVKLDYCFPGDYAEFTVPTKFECTETEWNWNVYSEDGCGGVPTLGSTNGAITADCYWCGASSPTPTPTPGATPTPVPCPTSSTSCDFYSCFDADKPCGSSGYALGFGEVNCQSYLELEPSLSSIGQTWSQGVRLCLQQALSKLHTGQLTCDQIWSAAVESHNGCYLGGNNGTWCDLPLSDQLQIINVAKSAIYEALPSVGHALSIGLQGFMFYGDCGKQQLANVRVGIEATVDQIFGDEGPGATVIDSISWQLFSNFLEQFPYLAPLGRWT